MKCDDDEMNLLLGRFERVRNPAVDVYTPPTADTAPIPLLPQPTWAEITSCTPPHFHSPFSLGTTLFLTVFERGNGLHIFAWNHPLTIKKEAYVLLNISHVKNRYGPSVSKS
jgi:hypothetical protein